MGRLMATLTVIWWRDIPAQVVAKDGRRSSKIVLHPRFQVAIDKAAMQAGKRAYDDYIEEWRKTQRAVQRRLEAGRPRGGAARGRVRRSTELAALSSRWRGGGGSRRPERSGAA